MKELFKGKFVTILVVIATIILAGVAIFTAIRLYQLRQESISLTRPESEPAAWDCKNYIFNVDANGLVTVTNNSDLNNPPQQAQVYINDQLKATLEVPALAPGQNATLGTVEVPQEEFSWRVVGTRDCSSSDKVKPQPIACELLTFSLSLPSPTVTAIPTEEVTPTVTETPEPTNSPTPTEPPLGGISPTPTSAYIAAVSPTPGEAALPDSGTASPTPGGAALPDAGISTPTLLFGSIGVLILILAFTLAL